MYAIDVLVKEHENITRLNKAMRAACLLALKDKKADVEDFKKFVELIRDYADRHHHGKEEAILFREMQAKLGPLAENLVKHGMLVEHDLGRLYVSQLDEAVRSYKITQGDSALLDILTNAMAYADLLKRHVDRENHVVYPFAEDHLEEEVLELLNKETKEFEAEGERAGLQSYMLSQLELLEKKYPVR